MMNIGVSWTLFNVDFLDTSILKVKSFIRIDIATATFNSNQQIHINYCVKIHSMPNISSLYSFDSIPFVIRFSHQGKTIAELAKATHINGFNPRIQKLPRRSV